MPVKITIRREGKFSIPFLTLANQCGREGQKEFRFKTRITVSKLDENGFVCDNFLVPRALEQKFAQGFWIASCEELAGAGVWLMHGLCQGRAERIIFEVSPIEEAGVEVEWQKGDELPDFVPRPISPQRERIESLGPKNQWVSSHYLRVREIANPSEYKSKFIK